MNWRPITKWLLVITALVWIVYDLFPFFNPARGDTISEVILYYALRLFSLPWAFGVLCGHFFWPRDGAKPKPFVLLSFLVSVIALDIAAYFVEPMAFLQKMQQFPAVFFFAGFPVGVLFWPQQKSDKLGGEL